MPEPASDRAHSGVSIVVPTWDGIDLLRANLPRVSSAAAEYPGPVQLLVVDDGSNDGSAEMVEREFSEFELVRHDRNRGFGVACGSGVEAARYPVVLLLNSDAWPEKGAIGPLVSRFRDAEVFAVSPLVFDPQGGLHDDVVNVPSWQRGLLAFRRRPVAGLESRAIVDPPIYTLYAIGGAIAFRRDRFLELGGFSAVLHPFYHEDTDLCFRAWRRGWTVVVEPRSVVVHAVGGTIGRRFGRFRVRTIRKRNRILVQWLNLLDRRRSAVQNAQLLARLLYKWLSLDLAFYAAFGWALMRLPSALAYRDRERREEKRTDEEVFALIASSLDDQMMRSDSPDGADSASE